MAQAFLIQAEKILCYLVEKDYNKSIWDQREKQEELLMKTKRKQISQEISVRILSVIITIFVLFCAIVAVMIGNISLSSQRNELELQSKSAGNELGTFFKKYTTIVDQMALNPDIQEILTDTKKGDSIKDASLYKDVYAELQADEAYDSDNILAAWIGDIDANVLTQSDGYTSDSSFDITTREWYQVTQTGNTMLTNAYTDASTGKLILSAAAPVYDKTGKTVVGVAGLDIALDHINEQFASYTVGDTGYVILLSEDGTFIYHPNSDYQLKTLKDVGVSDQVINALQNKENTSVKYNIGDSKRFGYIGNIADTNYYVLSCLPSGEYYSSLIKCIVLTVILALIGIGIIVFAIRKVSSAITKPIIGLNDVAQELAQGNLDVELKVQSDNEIGELADSIQLTVNRLKEYINYIDEIAEVLNRIADGKLKFQLKYDYAGDFSKVKDGMMNISKSLQEIVENILEGSAQVSSGADDLAKAAQSIAEGASTQSASIEELVATSTTVMEQVKENTEDARKSVSQTNEVKKMMENSNEQMNQMMEAMNKITETSNEVVGIIKTIEDIADQTNLLALNASIEAARAGEAGKGFAVVASEIGSLAEGSSKAANTTKDLIGVSIEEIEKGNQLATAVMESIAKVMEAVQSVNKQIEKSADNYVLQEQSMEQIELGIEEISRAVEDNSAASEEASATSEELAAQATTLEGLVNRFDLSDQQKPASHSPENEAETEA